MDVTFVLYNPGLSGGNRVLFEVANGLTDLGHTVKIVALNSQKWFELKPELIVCPNPQLLHEHIPESDVVFATYCWTAFAVDRVKGLKGIPAYYCQHYEPLFFINPEDQARCRATYELPLNLVSNSPWLQGVLKEKHERESFLIVPGVDRKTFKAKKKPVENEPYKVLAFSSLTHFKGFYDVTLPALNYAWRHLKNFEVHLYGRPDLPIPKDYKFPHVKHGFITDEQLAELYRSCDLYVSGSWYESSPLPPMEAMACGCATVCTTLGTEHYAGGVVRVPPKMPRKLGQVVTELLKYPEVRLEIRKNGLKKVKEFTWKKTVNKVDEFLETL